MNETHPFKLAGVMGWPVAHSRSPKLHGFWLAHYSIAGTYVPLPVAPGRVADALKGLTSRGIIRPAFIDRLLSDKAGQLAGEYGHLAWYMAVLERWLVAHGAPP